MQIRSAPTFFLLTLFLLAGPAAGDEFIFKNGFESGTPCAWSGQPCSLESILEGLQNATTENENEAALLAALERTIGSIPPELQEAVAVASEVVIDLPTAKGSFLSIAQAHELATLSLGSPPSLQDALTALSADVSQAYALPERDGSAEIILMFSASSNMSSPLPLTANSKLTFVGSIYYAAWLVEAFPNHFAAVARLSTFQCRAWVTTNQIAAGSQVVLRNVAVAIWRIVSAITNVLEAGLNCSSLGTTEVLGIAIDAAKDCAVGQFVSWVEADAEADCIGDASSAPDVVGCVAALIPCQGDIFSVINDGAGVVQALENLVNGVCTVFNSRLGLHAACDEGCSQCLELDVELPCEWGNIAGCFDPLNALPVVSCIPSEDAGCEDFGTPKITRIDGATIIPGGGSEFNRLYFVDEDAGIHWFSSTAVADTCGGCAQSGGWDPGVGPLTSGSFQFVWSCTCDASGDDFQATYQHRLWDSQGNVSGPYTQQVGCSCVASRRTGDSDSTKKGLRLLAIPLEP